MDNYTDTPDVSRHGPEGTPEVTVIGGVHGDEPAGVTAVQTLREQTLPLEKPIQLVIANPSAVERDTRYIETDLNRAYDDRDSNKLEHRLADTLLDIVSGTTTLSIHETKSTHKPFAIFDTTQTNLVTIANSLSTQYCVDPTPVGALGLAQYGHVIELEAGLHQYPDATTTQAERISKEFLRATGALPGEQHSTSPTNYFEMYERVDKPELASSADCEQLYDFNASNFEEVKKGQVFAELPSGQLTADVDFYPILMSECGYDTILGFKGRQINHNGQR